MRIPSIVEYQLGADYAIPCLKDYILLLSQSPYKVSYSFFCEIMIRGHYFKKKLILKLLGHSTQFSYLLNRLSMDPRIIPLIQFIPFVLRRHDDNARIRLSEEDHR